MKFREEFYKEEEKSESVMGRALNDSEPEGCVWVRMGDNKKQINVNVGDVFTVNLENKRKIKVRIDADQFKVLSVEDI